MTLFDIFFIIVLAVGYLAVAVLATGFITSVTDTLPEWVCGLAGFFWPFTAVVVGTVLAVITLLEIGEDLGDRWW